MGSRRKKSTLPCERTGQNAPPDLLARREALATAIRAGMWITKPPPQEVILRGIRTLIFRPARKSRGTVLHLHGGAFRLGCPEQVGPFAAALAERCGVTVVCPAYRLAPEHPFPACLSDARTVIMALPATTPSRLVPEVTRH